MAAVPLSDLLAGLLVSLTGPQFQLHFRNENGEQKGVGRG